MFDRILDGDVSAFAGINPDKSGLTKIVTSLLSFQGSSKALLNNLKSVYSSEIPGLKKPLDDFIGIVELLDSLDIQYTIDMDTGRGFEYYTGIIFHLSVNGEYIVGGGRYDDLIPFMSGKNTSASGFALYLDRLINLIPAANKTDVHDIIIKINTLKIETIKTGFTLLEFLHKAGKTSEIDIKGHKVGGINWIIEVKSSSAFNIINKISGKKYSASNAGEILKLIRNERVNKNSIAERSSSR